MMNRYHKYKQTGIEWIGEIPERWEVKKLKYLAEILNGQDHKSVWDEDGEYPIIGTGGEFGRANKYLHAGPSVILGRKGTIDKPQFKETPFWSVDTAYYTDINAGTDPKFFYYCCVTIQFDLYKYGSAVPSMTQEVLNQIQFAVPSLKEQNAIANYLDAKTAQIDKLIANKQQLIELLQEEKMAIIDEAVNGEGKNWQKKKLKYLATTNSENLSENEDENFRIHYVDISSVNENGGINLTTEYTFSAAPSRARRIVRKGDIILSTVRTYLRAIALIKIEIENLICSTGFAVIRAGDEIDDLFLFMICRSQNFIETVISLSKGVSYPSVNSEDLQNIEIYFPPIKEQAVIVQKIRNEIEKIDEAASKINQEVQLLTEFKTSLISEVVTGKIKVADLAISISMPSKQTALAAEIMSQLYEENSFGRVKFQKILYLCEYACNLEGIGADYLRAAAGPLDETLLTKIETELRQLQWIETVSSPSAKFNERISYTALPKINEYKKWYNKYWGEYNDGIQHIIGLLRFANTEKCEMIATVFAAWNDLILKGFAMPTDDNIINEVFEWHKAKRRFTRNEWQKELNFMRNQNLVPKGFGKPTRVNE